MPAVFLPPGLAPPAPDSQTVTPLPPPSYEIALAGQKPPTLPVADMRISSLLRRRRPKAFSPLTLPRNTAQFNQPLETVPEEPLSDSEESDSDGTLVGLTDSEPTTPYSGAYSESTSQPSTPSSGTFRHGGPSLTTRVDTLEINFDQLMKRVDGLRRKLTDMQLDVDGMEGTLVGLEKKKRHGRHGA